MASGRPRTRGVRPLARVVCVALASFLHCGQGSQGSECGLPHGNGSRGAQGVIRVLYVVLSYFWVVCVFQGPAVASALLNLFPRVILLFFCHPFNFRILSHAWFYS